MKFGLTQEFSCSYLPEKQEQLLVHVSDNQICSPQEYEVLISNGFRRSGEQVYRPHCPSCQACQSIRIPVELFSASKTQRRILKKNQDIQVFESQTDKPEYFEIYQDYITQRHSDGSMYPASHQQYKSFIQSDWMTSLYLEFYLQNELIAVAVTDILQHGLSALYTFFKPEYAHRSLGTYAILQQIETVKRQKKQFLYLGYQVDQCQKMNYKSKFMPHQRFFDNKWHLITKNSL